MIQQKNMPYYQEARMAGYRSSVCYTTGGTL